MLFGRGVETIRDWCAAAVPLRTGTAGAKPEEFCFWLFEVLGMKHDDELRDLFPGSGAVSLAFDRWRRQTRLPLPEAARAAKEG